MNCTIVPPGPLKLDALSIDFERVYSSTADMPRAKRRVSRTCPALKIELACDDS